MMEENIITSRAKGWLRVGCMCQWPQVTDPSLCNLAHRTIGSLPFRSTGVASRTLLLGVFCLFVAASGVPVAAQDEDGAPSSKPAAPDVYINDSFEAADAITAARRQAATGDWSESAKLMQRAATQFGDRLIKSDHDVFITIREHVNDLVCAWPEAGLAAYREQFEGEFTEKLEEAAMTVTYDDELMLFEQYFCTPKAAELAGIVAQAAIESGDFAVASRVYSRVLKQHPNAARFAEKYRGMQALVAVMNTAENSNLPDFNPGARIRWMGEERPIGEIIAAWSSAKPEASEIVPPNNWPMLAGDTQRNRRASTQVDELGLLWRYTGFGDQPPVRGRDVEDESDDVEREVVRFLSVQPTVRGGLLFLQDRRNIVALNRNTGFTAWRFRPDDSAGSGIDELDDHAPAADSPTVAEGRVFAALPGDSGPYTGYDGSRTPPEIVCLNAVTGRVIWRLGQKALGEAFSEISFDTSPLVDRGRVYVVARRRRSFGFEDAYLMRLNAADGKVEFRTHIGSASTGSFGFKRATTAIAALHGDVVFACTNLGTIAAVSADTGTVRWLRLYPRDAQSGAMESNWNLRSPSSWAFNPAIVSDGRLFVRPLDASMVLMVKADDGKLLRAISAKELGGAETLLGLHNDVLCTAGSSVVCYDVAAGGALWTVELEEAWRLSGRGVWMEEKLLIPTRSGLCTIKVDSGERQDTKWDVHGHSGNLLALPDQLFVVADTTISSYVRKTDLWNAMRARMTAALKDPLPAMEFAETALRGGDDREAFDLLQETVKRVNAADEPPETPFKRRLFNNLVLFAETLSERETLSIDELDQVCGLAAQHAPDAIGNLSFRLRCGALFEKSGKPENALALYQQILRDRSLRGLKVEDPDRSSTGTENNGGEVAQTRIVKLIEKHGSPVFAPYEAEARRWLDSGRAARDVDQLTRVVETFPNSQAAGEAMLSLGELARSEERFADAALILSRAFHRYGAKLERPRLISQIADSYARAKRPAAAYRWATMGVREFGETLVEREGRWIPFRELRATLVPADPIGEAARPRISPPLKPVQPSPLPEGATILSPTLVDQAGADWSRCYIHGVDGVHAFDGATGKSLWDLSATIRSAVELLFARKDYAVFASRHEVFALDAVTGARRWTHGTIPDHVDDPNRDWEEGGVLTNHALQDDQLVSVRDNGRMSSISVATGTEMWTRDVKVLPAGRIRLADPWVIYHAVLNGPTVLCQVNAATGDWMGVTPTDEIRPVEELYVALDGQVIFVTSQSIASYDIDAGVRRWRENMEGRLRQSSLRLDVDAAYFTQDGERVRKIALADGALVWESPVVLNVGDDDVTIERQGSLLIVGGRSTILALNEATGEIQWKGIVPENPRFVRRQMSQGYATCLNLGADGAESAVYFYDLREFSGVIPEKGGVIPLGVLEAYRQMAIFDGGLLLQEGNAIRWWGQ